MCSTIRKISVRRATIGSVGRGLTSYFFVDALSMSSVTETTTVQDATSVEEEGAGRMRGHEDVAT